MRPQCDFSDFFEQLQMYTSGMMGPVTQIKLHDQPIQLKTTSPLSAKNNHISYNNTSYQIEIYQHSKTQNIQIISDLKGKITPTKEHTLSRQKIIEGKNQVQMLVPFAQIEYQDYHDFEE